MAEIKVKFATGEGDPMIVNEGQVYFDSTNHVIHLNEHQYGTTRDNVESVLEEITAADVKKMMG